MRMTVHPFRAGGVLSAIPSKSEAHRLLIAASLSAGETEIACPETSRDIAATADCLARMGSSIRKTSGGYAVCGIHSLPQGEIPLPAGESGSTYRFLAPIVCALGLSGRFLLAGRLPERPMVALDEALAQHGGEKIATDPAQPLYRGQLLPGRYEIPGDVSSQFVSGLLFALPLLRGESEICLTTKPASRSYIDMTLSALRAFGVSPRISGNVFSVSPARYASPGFVRAGGDWSNAAFFLCAGAAGGRVTMTGLDPASRQGDRAVLSILRRFGADVTEDEGRITVTGGSLSGIQIDVTDTPDLVPALAVAAAGAKGETRLTGAARLSLKESDRLKSVTETLRALGVRAEHSWDEIRITGGGARGGTIPAQGDHRIAMMAGCMAALADSPVVIEGAEAVEKSYPGFFQDLEKIGGRYESEDMA